MCRHGHNATGCKAGRQGSRNGTSSFIDNNFLAVRISSNGYSVIAASHASLRRVLPTSNTAAGALKSIASPKCPAS